MFCVLLLKQYITKNRWVDKNVTKFNFNNNKEYKIGEI